MARKIPNVIKLRKEPSSEMSLALFLQKNKEILKKGLTKRQKCAVDFINSVNKIDPCLIEANPLLTRR